MHPGKHCSIYSIVLRSTVSIDSLHFCSLETQAMQRDDSSLRVTSYQDMPGHLRLYSLFFSYIFLLSSTLTSASKCNELFNRSPQTVVLPSCSLSSTQFFHPPSSMLSALLGDGSMFMVQPYVCSYIDATAPYQTTNW